MLPDSALDIGLGLWGAIGIVLVFLRLIIALRFSRGRYTGYREFLGLLFWPVLLIGFLLWGVGQGLKKLSHSWLYTRAEQAYGKARKMLQGKKSSSKKKEK